MRGINFLWWRRRKKQNVPNTLVIDTVKGRAMEYVPKPQGRQWLYGKDWVYLMVRNNGGKTLEKLELPKKLGVLPEVLYRALSWEKETSILFTLPATLLEKLSVFSTYVLIFGLLFFIYLIFSSL